MDGNYWFLLFLYVLALKCRFRIRLPHFINGNAGKDVVSGCDQGLVSPRGLNSCNLHLPFLYLFPWIDVVNYWTYPVVSTKCAIFCGLLTTHLEYYRDAELAWVIRIIRYARRELSLMFSMRSNLAMRWFFIVPACFSIMDVRIELRSCRCCCCCCSSS